MKLLLVACFVGCAALVEGLSEDLVNEHNSRDGKRTIAITLTNTDFRRVDVSSRVRYSSEAR